MTSTLEERPEGVVPRLVGERVQEGLPKLDLHLEQPERPLLDVEETAAEKRRQEDEG